ncbi:E3 ubiquitin/ISG15 ligase TRIM25-like [Eleutherodactylus coqui]|uniref:E3 ubiquitin/ISG15 ligase TRIM25-like n=1 Tax=Eleutherodactylus coqui TaxID=57060 RepID=UPI00346190C9
MASAAVRDELLCSICLSTYTDPVMLRCGHNFCRVCIHRVLDTQDEAGVYSCPECTEESQERPALMRCLALRNIIENFLITPPTQTEAEIFCTYCVDSPVAAAKSCLLCEASLCEKHLKVHSKSAEHVLCEPSANLEDRKCSVHKKILEYYCTEDAICICVTCSLAGEHRGHRVEMLDEASEKKKRLRNVLQKLITRREETEERVRSLEERRRKAQEKAAGEAKTVTALCRDIRRRLDDLEKRVLSEISRQEKEESLSLSALMKKLEIQKDELSRKMRHMEELCNMTDPLTVLQEPDTGDLYDPEDTGGHDGGDGDTVGHDGGDGDTVGHDGGDGDTRGHDGGDGDTRGHGEPLHDVDGPDVAVISDTLHTLCDIVTDIRRGIYVEDPADILLDVNTAANDIHISDDLKTATSIQQNQNRPETLQRFQYDQVMSRRGFSSGRYYWDVEGSRSGGWMVGMCYPSIDRRGQQSYIGYNNKSWCLWRSYSEYSVRHDSEEILLPHIISSNRFRICLDYGAGRLSFYELCDPIRHLHTFTASFTEPLHAVLWVFNGSITILGEATTGRNHNRN